MKPIRTAILTALYTCLAFLHASCVREDTEDCVQYQVHVRVVDAAGNDLTESGVLEKSEVYLFGENGFVRMVPAGVSSDYLFGNYKEARLTLVAWGNIKEDTLITADIKPGTPDRGSTPETETTCRRKPFARYRPLLLPQGAEQHRYKEHTGRRHHAGNGADGGRIEHTDMLSGRALSISGRSLYLHCTGNGFRSGFHGKSNRRKRRIQTAYRHGLARRCLCPTLPHISDPGRRIHRSGNIQEAGKAVHRYARQRATALARGGRETDRHRDRFQKDRDKGIRKSTAVGRSGTGNGNVS